jgi:hypothetical protein
VSALTPCLDDLWLPPERGLRLPTGSADPIYVGDFGKFLRDAILWMAGGLGSATAQAIWNEMFGATNFTADTHLYAGLWTSALSVTSTSASSGETTYGSYARFDFTNNTTNFPVSTGSAPTTGSNGTAATFPTSTSGTATIISGGLFSVASGAGASRAWGDISSTVINSGDTPKINVGGFVITLAATP